MGYSSVTPFRRARDAARVQPPLTPLPCISVDKWHVLREIITARSAFGLNDRDIAVLQVLLSFHPETRIEASASAPVVFPSNNSICERLGGMPCSTMRRHLARLVDSGLIARRDSPNGKRYCRRSGPQRIAFGFDLSPLLRRLDEITQAADAARAEQARCIELREMISLMRRDLLAIAEDATVRDASDAPWQAVTDLCALVARALRRKLSLKDLNQIAKDLDRELHARRTNTVTAETEEMSTKHAQNEHHQQRPITDLKESELLRTKPETIRPITKPDMKDNIKIDDVLMACHEIQTYCPDPIQTWRDLIRVSHTVRPMMGIPDRVWADSLRILGPETTSVVIAAMLERFIDIRSPGAYLQSLLTQAKMHGFTPTPMVRALLNARAA